MQRRTLLSTTAAAAGLLAGCTGLAPGIGTDPGTDTDGRTVTDRPTDCPISQGLGVEWPDELDAASVTAFVEAYETAYYREVVVEYEPESPVDKYGLTGGIVDEARSVGDGWVVEYSGSGGVYRPTLYIEATTAAPPDGTTVASASEIDDETVREVIETAAETGAAETHVDSPGEPVAQDIELFGSLSPDFGLDSPGDEDRLYVAVNGTTVELGVQASNFHGDYWWSARYFVTDEVVRRASEKGVAAPDGTLLECRPS
jgi:hypothetical protein